MYDRCIEEPNDAEVRTTTFIVTGLQKQPESDIPVKDEGEELIVISLSTSIKVWLD